MNRSGPAEVEFRSVAKLYGSVRAVGDISFKIEPGTLVTLLGPSGCGKTTTLRLIAGLEIPTHGQIIIGGADVTRSFPSERDGPQGVQPYPLFPPLAGFGT